MTVIKMVRLTQNAYDFLLEIKGEHMIKGVNKTFSQIVIDLVNENQERYEIMEAMLAERKKLEDGTLLKTTSDNWKEYVKALNKINR